MCTLSRVWRRFQRGLIKGFEFTWMVLSSSHRRILAKNLYLSKVFQVNKCDCLRNNFGILER